MPIDHSEEIKTAIIAALKADGAVAEIVGQRVYDRPPAEPPWPFIRYGAPILGPYEASGWDGSDHDITIHTFAEGPDTKSVNALNKAVVAALDGFSNTDIADGPTAIDVQWVSTQVIRDGIEDHHGILRFTATTVEIKP